jgi:hypothetical protein
MTVEPDTTVRGADTRKVWVENIMNEPYAEKFHEQIVEVPASGKIMMPFLEAHRFVSQWKAPLKKDVNGMWQQVKGPKPLRVIEMSDEEREKLTGVTPKQVEASEKAADQKVRLTCMKCGFQAVSDKGLKIHASAVHPEMAAE